MQKTPTNRQSEKNISTEWFHGLDPSQHEEFKKAWRNSTYVLDKLKAILQRQIDGLQTDREDDYDNPQWAVLRADRNGQLRMLRQMINLLP